MNIHPDYTPGNLDRTAPEKIWLQINADGDNSDRDEPWAGTEGVTWQDESIGGLEIQYVRADLASVCESAPAAVTDEMVNHALAAYYGGEAHPNCFPSMRVALEAVAPMLAGVPDNVQRVAEHMARSVEYIEKVYPGARQLDAGPIMRNLRRWSKMLAAVAKPDAQGDRRG